MKRVLCGCLCIVALACGGKTSPGMTGMDLGPLADPGGAIPDDGPAADVADEARPDAGPPPGCTDTVDCALGLVCHGGECVPGCRAERDCPEPLHCDPTLGEHGWCVMCVEDGQCDGTLVCRERRCVVDCAAVECPVDRRLCDPADGSCVECLERADCPEERLCVQRACVPGCEQDADCRTGWHCRLDGGAVGSCVECFEAGHCTGGRECLGGACIQKACGADADCPTGKFCHPLLRECLALPPKACGDDGDCGILGVGGFCDPLTRTCIDPCVLGRCLAAGKKCVDGGCYECGADADCAGTPCSRRDRTCDGCKTDGDCVSSGWHCDVASGACRECVTDEHCPGGVCHPDKDRCVECLDDGDCKDPLRPTCGPTSACQGPCQPACQEGQVRCPASDTRSREVCLPRPDNGCLDWRVVACSRGQVCQEGACVCGKDCVLGEAKCSSMTLSTVCQRDPETTCRYWENVGCAAQQHCDGGYCVDFGSGY
jgi:hypothetical protein